MISERRACGVTTICRATMRYASVRDPQDGLRLRLKYLAATSVRYGYLNKVNLDFSRPGKPTDIAFIESFNSKRRMECLNQLYFMGLSDAEEKIDSWRREYNEARPHGSLGYLGTQRVRTKKP